MSCLLQYRKNNPDAYFWIDIFCKSQHETGDIFTFAEFSHNILAIGALLIVPMFWDRQGSVLARAWCLWEIYCGSISDVKIDLVLTEHQWHEFKSKLTDEADGQVC